MTTGEIYFVCGLWTYICLASARRKTYIDTDFKQILIGFLSVMIMWPMAPLIILAFDSLERK